MRLAAAIVLLVCATARAQSAAPAGEDVDIAKAHFATGEVNYEHGRFADAAREFEEAYRLSGKAPLLYNVGKSYDGANDFARALDAYQRFLAAAPPTNPDRDFATRRVELLQSLVGKIALAGAVDGSALVLDGKSAGTTPLAAPLVVNPGRHKLELAHEGFATFRSAVDVPVGGSTQVAVKQTEAVKVVTVAATRDKETPVYKKWWLWVAVGGAVVAAGVITAVVVSGDSANHGIPTVQLPQVK
ncbi:MAG TPA: tetratricopeptide repeat protein [Polyangia bacterium]